MSLPKVIFTTGVHLSVTHVTNTPRPRYEVQDRDTVRCVCDDEDNAVSIARALALVALIYDATVGVHWDQEHR